MHSIAAASLAIDDDTDGEVHRIRSLLDEGLRRARRQDRSVLVSMVRSVPSTDPLRWLEQGAQTSDESHLWSRPNDGYALAGVGAAWSLSVRGPRRFADAAAAWRERCSDALIDNSTDVVGTGPVLMGGFAFDPEQRSAALWRGYPDGQLVLPQTMLTSADGAAWLTTNAVVQPGDDLDELTQAVTPRYPLSAGDSTVTVPDSQPLSLEDAVPAAAWKATVETLVRDIARGEVQKVVLARMLQVSGERPFNQATALRWLSTLYPECFVFAVAREGRCFLGASPERLARLHHGLLSTSCLAGSIARGATAETDRQLEQALLASDKERAEHEFVVRAMHDALTQMSVATEPFGPPTVMKMANVQHLFTAITGRAVGGCTILDLVERLHPTPAVGGYPREAALQAIRTHESLDRGWYAGPVGWLDARGDGEFAVAIRSALLDEGRAALFAGCGIVAGSDPEREYAESCLKLRPILSALGGATL